MPAVVAPLGAHHARDRFSCGQPALDRYLRERAGQDMRRGVAQVFVALGGDETTISGFYTLSATSFERDALPAPLTKRLPHHPVPAALLGRLAVDGAHQGRGLGGLLLADAVDRVSRVAASIAVYALVVDAKDDDATRFYRHFGFISFPVTPSRLFLPVRRLDAHASGR